MYSDREELSSPKDLKEIVQRTQNLNGKPNDSDKHF